MTVKNKLRLIFLLFFLLIGGLTYYSNAGLSQLDGDLQYVSGNVTPQVKRLEELAAKVAEFRINEASHILSLTAADMDAHEAEMKRLKSEIETLGQQFLSQSESTREKQDFAEFQSAWAKYLDTNAKLLPISRQYDSHDHIAFLDQATEIFNKESLPLFQAASAP